MNGFSPAPCWTPSMSPPLPYFASVGRATPKSGGTVLFLITSELLITDSIVVFHNCCSEQQTAVQRITGYEEKGVASERRPW